MIVNGFDGKQQIELDDTEVCLTQEQAEDLLNALIRFKMQEENAPFPEDDEAIIDGESVDDVIIVNSIEIVHRKQPI